MPVKITWKHKQSAKGLCALGSSNTSKLYEAHQGFYEITDGKKTLYLCREHYDDLARQYVGVITEGVLNGDL